jgi:hypothetical protein
VPNASAIGARIGSRVGALGNQLGCGFLASRDGEHGKRRGGAANERLESKVGDREAQRFHDERLVGVAVDSRRQMAAAIDGWYSRGAVLWSDATWEAPSCRRSSQSDRRIVLKRTIDFRHLGDRFDGVCCAVVPKRFDHHAAEKGRPCMTRPDMVSRALGSAP